MNPTAQPTKICSTPRIRVQRLSFAFKLSMSFAIGIDSIVVVLEGVEPTMRTCPFAGDCQILT